MFIADAHCDTLYSIAITHDSANSLSVTPESLRIGGVGLQTFAMFCGSNGAEANARENAVNMLEAAGTFGVPMLSGELPETPPETPHGVFSIEGGEILEGSLDALANFDDTARIRMIALTWNFDNEIATPAAISPEGGLKPFGFELLREMDKRGILTDVSHLNEAGFWDVCERAALPPIASHSNCRWLCDVKRNLNRDQAKAIIERGGFIGINFYSAFLNDSGTATLNDVFRHMDALLEMGAENVLGFGSDFDGITASPEGLKSPADYPALIDLMHAHGYSQEVIIRIAGLNLYEKLRLADAVRR